MEGLSNDLISASEELDTAGPPYTDAHIVAYPVEYIAGIDLFNEGEFHAAHDAWEDRWMGEVGAAEKLFLQAMIQSAVAFHHLEIGRPGAARRVTTGTRSAATGTSAGPARSPGTTPRPAATVR